MYYIFSDGDIKLRQSNFRYRAGVTKEFERIKNNNRNNYEKFEDFLLEYIPAIGSIENQFLHPNLPVKIDVRQYYFYFDAQFNAYHHSVIDDLLPYDNKEQATSYAISQQHQQCRSLFRYHGLVYSFTPVFALNDAHSPYPRGIIPYNITCFKEFKKTPFSNPAKHLLNYLVNLKPGFPTYTFKFMSKAKASLQKYSNDSMAVMEKNCKYSKK